MSDTDGDTTAADGSATEADGDATDADSDVMEADGDATDAEASDDSTADPPGTFERAGYAAACFLVLGFALGGAVQAVTAALLLSPALGATASVGTLVTAATAGLLSGVRRPPAVSRVLAFSLVSVALQFLLGALLVPTVGDLRGSAVLAADVALTWTAALSLAWALVFGVDWSGPRERLRRHLRGERDG
jgi:hypothetical protein